ncbi:MAG: hypothetical protein PHV13_00575 [Candidatus ainarchaeum sp.]|nr:hypothetical protein [Candidatus ainarchaeum sp.]
MNLRLLGLLGLALLLTTGCIYPHPLPGPPANGTGIAGPNTTNAPMDNTAPSIPYKNYTESALSFYTFTEPNEGAFSLEVPEGWVVTPGSGLVRPYIDAAVAFEAKSPSGQGVFIQDPYVPIYATPNQLLDFAGFTEGSQYDPSGGIAQPMVVQRYADAPSFASGLLSASGITASNVAVVERPDLLQAGNPLVSQQSAAELSFDYNAGGQKMRAVLLVRTVLIELSGTGVWYASVMEYYSPEELMNETELLALHMQKSFRVDPAWAAREQAEVRKRSQILSQSQSDISEIISSTFEMRSRTMDDLNRKWDNYILGVEDVYGPATGEHYVVDSGSNYYWADAHGNVYGTDTADNPFPLENLQLLTRK